MKITLFLSAKKNIYLIQSTPNFSLQFLRNKNGKKKSIYHILGQYLMTFPFSFSFCFLTNYNKKGRVQVYVPVKVEQQSSQAPHFTICFDMK